MDARELTLELLSWPSVTGSIGERAFGPRLRDRLAAVPGLEVWLEDAGAGRFTVCALSRGTGDAGVVLAGHYDVVDDTGMEPPHFLDDEWLAGRGALDMKSGLAGAIVTLARHAATPDRAGSVLLVACPDEEAHSAGARVAAPAIRALGLDWRLGINADVVTEAGDGSYARGVFCGTIGKSLLCALVRGRPAHVGEPLVGVSAHWLAAEVVREIEGQGTGTPPVLLSGGDTKAVYDVTMPRDVLLVFNLLHEGSAAGALAVFRRRVADALASAYARWPGDRTGAVRIVDADVPASTFDPVALAEETLTAAADAAGLDGPGAVVGLGSVRYRPVPFDDAALMARLRPVIEAAGVRVAGPYPNPSDISFLADAGDFPWVNAGPWGRDFHRASERVHAPYAFEVLPELLSDMVAAALYSSTSSRL